MGTVLVTGGSGNLGSCLVPTLRDRGHEVRVLSRQPGRGTHTSDLTSGDGIDAAARGADVIVHAASDTRRAGWHDARQTSNLLASARDAANVIYISIVGVDKIPNANFGYYARKLACERSIEAGPAPYTILRATQFHELFEYVFTVLGKLPVAPLPLDVVFQSIAAQEVAEVIAGIVDSGPQERAPDIGGPEVVGLASMVKTWQRLSTRRIRPIRVPAPGRTGRAFREGLHTCPDRAIGTITWEEFLARKS